MQNSITFMPWSLEINFEEYVVYGLVIDGLLREHFVSFKFHFDEMVMMFALYYTDMLR